MNILVCFTGLVRTIEKTINNLKYNLFDSKHNITVIFVTWDYENTDNFTKEFPEAKIYKIPSVSIEDPNFIEWKKNTIMHYSWIINTGSNDNALFHYYKQLFIWKQAGIIIEDYDGFDLFVRARTDITLTGNPLNTYYSKVNSSNIFFPDKPRKSFIKDKDCPDYFFIASKSIFLYAIKILDNINYIFNKYKYHIQPELTMYFHLIDKNINIQYMNNSVTIIRNLSNIKPRHHLVKTFDKIKWN